MNIYNVIKRPIVTEKATILREAGNQYAFEVDPSATKVDVKRAIEHIFNVRVAGVKTITLKGSTHKNLRTGRMGHVSGMKKAVVALKKGDKIEIVKGA